jgi:heme a synthase
MAPLRKQPIMDVHLRSNSPAVAIWLWAVAFLIFCMVIVGGATRLTDSGLSITEWKPLLGAIPPLTDNHWVEAFEKYKLIPEYQIQNKGMSLEDFKFIYWWEWAHRFLGRVIGFAFLLPLVFFIATRRIDRSLWPRLIGLFVLGGLQGALGWYMVSSGLSERVDVSQYRLAAHLSLATALFAAIVYTALTLQRPARRSLWWGSRLALLFVCLLFLQIAAGGFVAGLDAGHAAYDWPTMNGQFLPDGLHAIQPLWRNWFENALAVQFNHRMFAYFICVLALLQAFLMRQNSSWLVVAAVGLQVLLGIATVVGQVQLYTALAHQGVAMLLLAVAVRHYVVVSRGPVPGLR